MTPYQLKRNVIYYAIQGKLCEQIPTEETSRELLRKNAQIRESTIEKNKGKRCKPIRDGDRLFDIPENWAWERFGNLVFNYDSRRRPVAKDDRKRGSGKYSYYGATGAIDEVDEYIFDGEYLMIGEDGGNFFTERDNSFIATGKFWANNHVHVVKPIVCNIWYLKHCLDAYNLPGMGLINGIAAPKLNQENMNSIMIPVPPLAEQARIVAKLAEIFPFIDRYARAWNQLENVGKRFPADLHKSILQMAIQGKLAEQKSTELPVDLTKIKTKKTEEFGFEIPENWKLAHLESISNMIPSKPYQILESQVLKSGAFPVISQSKEYSIGFYDRSSKVFCHDSPVIVFGDHTAEVKYVEFDFVVGADGVKIFEPICDVVDAKFLYYVFQYYSRNLNQIKRYSRHYKYLKNKAIPLPPLAEQKRIVTRLEELMSLCDRLK